ncbi:Ig-like domain-containing protein [Duffyella gerundensis]|uniref:Ig-like domain-containing protein n=1 Tax=Duffyella gerundensis TaxID=1619313 RepID=UPI0021F75169|nr:Ig-like domain-containing protein [Duffyella gerundensis]
MKDSKIDPRTGTTRNNETLNAQNTLLSAVTPMITEIYSDTGRTTGAVRPGSAIDDAMPRFTGSAAPGSLVAVYSRGIKLGEGYANDQGIFSFVTTTPFADGEQFITLQATQADGEVAYSDFFILHYRAIKHPVDADQPVDQEPLLSKPVIEGAYDNRNGEVLIENRFTEDTTPLLKGTADPLAIVYITNILNDVLGSVQANNDGKWELEIEASYAGPFKAIAVDAQNPASVSYASETIDVWVGTEPPPRPSAPVIESAFDNVDSTGNVSNNGITDDARPRFSGKAVPGSLVKIYSVHTGEVLGEGYADENGNFSFETTADLQLGLNMLYATSTVKGVESSVSNLFDIQYVNAPYIPEPFVPPYASAANVDEPFADSIANGATTPDFTPTLIGKANVNATVIIRLNGNVIGEVQANYDGSWHYDVKTPLEPGENVFTFAGINDGEEQISEQSFTLNIALSAKINYAEDDVGEQTDNLYTGYFTDDSQPTLRGVGTPNGMVKIYTEKGLLGSAQINEKGEWHFTPDVALPPGLHTFHPVVEYPGMATPVTGEEFMLEIAIPPSLTPEIWSVYDNQGDHSIVENGASTDDATPTFSGSAYGRGMTIVVRDNGKAIGQTEVNSNGEWTWTPETALEAGSYSLTFEVVDNKGNVHASEPFIFDVVTPVVTQILYADDNVGDITDALHSGDRTDDETPTLHGSSSPNSLVNIYYQGYYYLGSAKSNANGEWRFTPSHDLPAGTHDFFAREVNEYGSELAPGPNFTLEIVPVVPPIEYFAPTVDAAYDNKELHNHLRNGDITDDTTPRFSGNGMPNSIIEVYDHGEKIADAKVDGQGNWSWTPGSALPTGDHRFSFVTVGEDGSHYASDDFNLEIINQVAGRIISAEDNVGDVTDPLTSGARTDDTTPTLNGVGTPNGTVDIYNGYRYLGSAEINADGEWSFTPYELDEGVYHFHATVTGPDGTVLAQSPAFDLTIAKPVEYFAPTVGEVYDYVGWHKALENGDYTDDTAPDFHGGGMPGSTIQVYVDGKPAGEVKVNDWGYWNFKPNTALEPGSHTFRFVTLGEDGKEYASEAFNLQVISHTPGRIDLAEDNAGDVTDPLSSGARTDDTTPTLKGVGTPNGIVTIWDNWNPIGSVKINANGEWSFTPSRDLPEGSHSFNAVVTGPDGTTLDASPDFKLDIQLPAPPIEYFAPTVTSVYDDERHQTTVRNGGLTDDTTPHFSGRGMPDSIIDVHLDGEKIGEASVNYMGYWSFMPDTALEPGNHRFSFVTVGADGQQYASDDFNLEVITQVAGRIDFAEDNVGDITDPLTSGARTDDTTPTLHGVGTPGGIVTVYYGNWNTFGSAKINADGTWSITPTRALSAGEHNFFASVTGPDGTTLESSPIFTLDIAPFVPPIEYFAPTITNVYDDEGRHNYLSSGDSTDDTTPRFSGRGMPGSTIEVRLNGEKIGEASVTWLGYWEFTSDTALEPGNHRFSFVTVGADGQEYASDDFNLEVISHVAGRIDFAEDNVGAATDPLTSGSRTDDTTPTLKGVGSPNGTVEIHNGYRYLGSAKINADGEWSFTPDALQDGSYSFRATVISPDGTRLAQTPAFDLIIEKPVDYYAPTVSDIEDNVGRNSVGSRGGMTDDTTPTFSGRAVAGSTLQVRIDGKTQYSVEVDEAGRWSWTPSPALQPGKHAFTFVSTDAAGNEFISDAIPLEIIAHVTGRIVSADDNVGEVTDALVNGSTTDDAQPTLRGVGTPGGSVEIFYDGKLMSYAEINDKGEWSYTPNSTLSNGSHEFYVVVTSPDGTTLPAGPTFSLIIDAPVVYFAPVINGVVDNVHSLAFLSDGDTTDDATPSFVGNGLADSTIAVYVNDQYYGEAEADPWGVWTYTPSPALEQGEHTFTFVSVDDQGTEYRSGAFTLNIEPAIPLTILFADDDIGAITDPLFSGSTTDDSQPTLRGTGMPGSIIEIFGTGGVFGSEKIDSDGNWSWTPDKPLPAGDYSFVGIMKDSYGFESERTDWFELTITAPEIDRSLTVRSLLQDADAPLFDEPQTELSTTQPVEPTAFVPASAPLVQEWESTTNHY